MKVNVRIGNNTYLVEIEQLDKRPIVARIGDDKFEIWPDENSTGPVSTPENSVLPSAKFSNQDSPTNRQGYVKAPIPGVIVTILIKVGDEVEVGQELCVLEAMKMKNTIRAGRAGKIASVLAAIGQQVKHNELLFEFVD